MRLKVIFTLLFVTQSSFVYADWTAGEDASIRQLREVAIRMESLRGAEREAYRKQVLSRPGLAARWTFQLNNSVQVIEERVKALDRQVQSRQDGPARMTTEHLKQAIERNNRLRSLMSRVLPAQSLTELPKIRVNSIPGKAARMELTSSRENLSTRGSRGANVKIHPNTVQYLSRADLLKVTSSGFREVGNKTVSGLNRYSRGLSYQIADMRPNANVAGRTLGAGVQRNTVATPLDPASAFSAVR